MPWQGNKDTMIDRFDARAHLDFITEVPAAADNKFENPKDKEMRQVNYERYRILVQNEFLKSRDLRWFSSYCKTQFYFFSF